MKPFIFVVLTALVALVVLAPSAWAFGPNDVARMVEDGVPNSLIIQKIRHSGVRFHLDARDIRNLRADGVPDEVISAMLATEDERYGDDYAPDYGYAPVYPYYAYHPYYYHPYYPRVVFSFGFNSCFGPRRVFVHRPVGFALNGGVMRRFR